jgi:hypothetical protein
LTHPQLVRCFKSMNLLRSELLEKIGSRMFQLKRVQQFVQEKPED